MWAKNLLNALRVIIVFQIVFALLVLLLSLLHVKINTSYAVVVSGGTFAELLGLCLLVVKHLFPSKDEIEDLSKSKFKDPDEPAHEDPEEDEALTDLVRDGLEKDEGT